MLTPEMRGFIVGGEKAEELAQVTVSHEFMEVLAHRTFKTLNALGYAHIVPEADFVVGFANGFKCNHSFYEEHVI